MKELLMRTPFPTGPGYNEEGWTRSEVCDHVPEFDKDKPGCGRTFNIKKRHLFVTRSKDGFTQKPSVEFMCQCGAMNNTGLPVGGFTNLPEYDNYELRIVFEPDPPTNSV